MLDWKTGEDFLRRKIEDLRISLVGGLILAALTLLSGYLVYVVMQQQAESVLGHSLESSLLNNQRFFSTQIGQNIGSALAISQRPFAVRNLQLLDKQPNNIRAQQELKRIAQSLL